MMKVLIVDDEFPARRELRAQLTRVPNVEVVGEAASAEEAVQLIRALPYDIVFLDIEMPGMSGMELAQKMYAGGPRVVFTTAYPQYAVEAFQVGAAGYLLKPFDEERLGRVLERIAHHLTAGPQASTADEGTQHRKEKPQQAPPRIPAERGSKTILVHPGEVAYVFAQEEQVYMKLHNERLPCRFTLRQLEERLQPFGFLRVHRRFLVNLEKVREVVPYFKGSLTLVVTDAAQSEIPVSRNASPLVRQRLGLSEH